MLAFEIDAAHQLGQVDIQCLRYAAQLNPECIFKADAGFMTANDEGSLYDARTQMAVRSHYGRSSKERNARHRVQTWRAGDFIIRWSSFSFSCFSDTGSPSVAGQLRACVLSIGGLSRVTYPNYVV